MKKLVVGLFIVFLVFLFGSGSVASETRTFEVEITAQVSEVNDRWGKVRIQLLEDTRLESVSRGTEIWLTSDCLDVRLREGDRIVAYGLLAVNPAMDPWAILNVCEKDSYWVRVEDDPRREDPKVDISMGQNTYQVGEAATIRLRFSDRGKFILRQTRPSRKSITGGDVTEGIERIRGRIEEPTGRKEIEVRFKDRHGNTATASTTYEVLAGNDMGRLKSVKVEVSCDEFEMEKDVSKSAKLEEGGRLEVSLCTNPSTGYEWSDSPRISDRSVLRQTSHTTSSSNGKPGAPGESRWEFKALGQGKSTISFENSRPWESNGEDNWSFRLQVKVGDQEDPEVKSCISSGGKITAATCCKSVGDFPDTCKIGACGCAPENSHEVKICDCGPGECFNGEKCVTRKNYTGS